MTTTIPCMRPKVDVEPHPSGVAGAWQGLCRVPGCATPPYNSVKTACEEFAVRHRAEHRAAVPITQVGRLENGGYRASCQCRAIASESPLTRTDAEAWVAYHLSTAHGLVSC